MNNKIRKTKLDKAGDDLKKPSEPSMSFRFGEETIDKLGMLSVHLGRSMAATVRELIHAQFAVQFDGNKAAASEATKKWAAKKENSPKRRRNKKEQTKAP